MTLDKILDDAIWSDGHCEKAKAAIKALVMACVPEPIEPTLPGYNGEGWNNCRDKTMKRIEELFR